MTKPTPICDLIERLVSTGMSPGDAIAAARPVEATVARSSGTDEERREKWRLKKARQRAAKGGHVPSNIYSSSSSKTQSSLKKVSKKDSTCPPVPGTIDDWPEGYAAQFWDAYPPGRKYDKAQVFALLGKLRAEGFVNAEKKRERLTWAALKAGLDRYAATNPGDYTKAPLPWLRGQRWQGDYGFIKGGSNAAARSGGNSFSALAAKIRNSKPSVGDVSPAPDGEGGDRPDDAPRNVARH